MTSKHKSSINRRSFFKTSGLAVAGFGLPVNGYSNANFPEVKVISQSLPNIQYDANYVVVSGGFAGVCSAITAVCPGLKVTKSLTVQLYRSHENVPVSLFGLQAFG